MKQRILIRPGCYRDSAFLMRLSRELSLLPGIVEAVVLMGTTMNRELMRSAGFSDEALDRATPMDLLVGIRAGTDGELRAAGEAFERIVSTGSGQAGHAPHLRYPSLSQALAEIPQANLVSVAVPGPYAASVAQRALDAGRNVFLFSDNVPLDDEIALKRQAAERGLLLMGPDCGTALLAGVPLGFMNRVRRGNVGIIGASGTGIQEVSCLLHRLGLGVSQAIGVGSRDLKAKVDGLMTEFALDLLSGDDRTEIVVLVAKRPDPAVADRLHPIMNRLGKPVIVRYLGEEARDSTDGVFYASSLDEAASCVPAKLGERPPVPDPFAGITEEAGHLCPVGGGRLVGLFGGGSLAAEAAHTLLRRGLRVTQPEDPLGLTGPVEGSGHLIVDCGDDCYTIGKPHPMVDQTQRCRLIRKAVGDPAVSVLLLDLVLGDGSHPDPAPEIAAELESARKGRGKAPLLAVASVTGTELDPQDANRQAFLLRSAGIHVQPSAARAARIAAIVAGGKP